MRFYFLITFLIIISTCIAQKKQAIQLYNLQKNDNITAIHRTIKYTKDRNKEYLQLSEDKEEGILWLPIKKFKTGTIELVMRGKDELQKSFIGIAFHGLNDSTFDAVYCRPFNFFAKDSVRRIHAIQYIAHPFYTWKKLREEQNALFEKEITSPPDPNDWFILKLVITETTVEAFINNSSTPSLVVNKLNKRTKGKLGLFVGDSSGGDFEQVTITHN